MRFVRVAAAILASSALPASAQTIASNFTRTTSAENLMAAFTTPSAATSSRIYTGSVEVLVSGTGFSFGSRINDAFYMTSPPSSNAGNYYHLGLGTASQPLTGSNPTLGIERFMSFINNVGFVSAGTVPNYAANNTYNFVINLGAQNTALSFGVLDGVYADNGGAYNISLWQLTPGVDAAVPEPTTWAMLILGFGLIGGSLRSRRGERSVTFA